MAIFRKVPLLDMWKDCRALQRCAIPVQLSVRFYFFNSLVHPRRVSILILSIL